VEAAAGREEGKKGHQVESNGEKEVSLKNWLPRARRDTIKGHHRGKPLQTVGRKNGRTWTEISQKRKKKKKKTEGGRKRERIRTGNCHEKGGGDMAQKGKVQSTKKKTLAIHTAASVHREEEA